MFDGRFYIVVFSLLLSTLRIYRGDAERIEVVADRAGPRLIILASSIRMLTLLISGNGMSKRSTSILGASSSSQQEH